MRLPSPDFESAVITFNQRFFLELISKNPLRINYLHISTEFYHFSPKTSNLPTSVIPLSYLEEKETLLVPVLTV